jgi:hypothetical protein
MELVRKNMKVGIAAIGLLAGAAAAQDGDFNKPLARTKERAAQPGNSSSQTRIVTQDGDDTYEITISGGDLSAKVNGKRVPAERIRRSKDKVEILDKDGDVLKTFDIASTDGQAWRALGGGAGGGMGGFDPDMPKPKVMIGITMSEDEDGVVVEHVYDGLPAAKAGLKARDVIVEVDGAKKLDQKAFREALNKKDAGEKVLLKIRRDGDEKDITIELQKFDADKLAKDSPFQWRGEFKGMEAPQGMQDAFKDNPEMFRRFNDAMKDLPEGQRAYVWGAGPEGQFKFAPFTGPDTKRVEELDKKIAELDEKLSRINEQMARLEKLISKLGERDGGR